MENQQMIDCEWPYIFPEDDIQWNAVEHQHSTEFIVNFLFSIHNLHDELLETMFMCYFCHIQVRYLPSIRCVDSMVLDMAPWALFGNCTGIKILLCGPNGEDLCTVNHLDVIIPPPLLMKVKYILFNTNKL